MENYDDSPDGAQAQTATQTPEKPAAEAAEPEEKPGDEGGQTALVPMQLCPGMKPGDEMVVKIDRVLDDQYEVSYSPEPKDKEEPAAPPKAEIPPGDGEMAGMMD